VLLIIAIHEEFCRVRCAQQLRSLFTVLPGLPPWSAPLISSSDWLSSCETRVGIPGSKLLELSRVPGKVSIRVGLRIRFCFWAAAEAISTASCLSSQQDQDGPCLSWCRPRRARSQWGCLPRAAPPHASFFRRHFGLCAFEFSRLRDPESDCLGLDDDPSGRAVILANAGS